MADVSITAANFLVSSRAKVSEVTFGGTVTAGVPCYRDESDGKYKPADANASAATAVAVGLAMGGYSDGQRGLLVTEDPDLTPGFTTVEGTIYIVSSAAGAIAPSTDAATGMRITALMVGKASNKANFRPIHSPDAVPA